MEDLPACLVEVVLAYLPPADVAQCARVCTRLATIATLDGPWLAACAAGLPGGRALAYAPLTRALPRAVVARRRGEQDDVALGCGPHDADAVAVPLGDWRRCAFSLACAATGRTSADARAAVESRSAQALLGGARGDGPAS